MSAIDYLDTVLDVDARAKFRLAIAKALAALRLEATGDVQKELEEVCSRRLYEQTLENIECVLQTSVRVRTSANPYGLQPASQNTVNNRRSTFRSICKEVTGSEPEQPCNKNTAQWVTQVDRVIAAMDKIYDSFGSWSQAFILFMQTLRLLRLDDLSTVYYERFRTLSEEKSKDKKSSKTLLSEEEVESIREAVEQAADDALQTMDEATVQSALAMLFIWGTSSDWQPQRRDCLTYVFLGPQTNVTTANYYDSCTSRLTINKANKVSLRQPVEIDVQQNNPKLAELLNKLANNGACTQILFNRKPDGSCQPVSGSCLNYRLQRAFETFGLSPELAKKASSVNQARHAAVRAGRKRRRLSPAERQQEATAARQRLSSVSMAENVYDQ